MSEYDHEPVRGLPAILPEGENILWQSAPDWKYLLASALHVRLTVLYFAAIIIWAVARGDGGTAMGVAALGVAVLALLAWFAWGVGRTTLYTLTNKRLVLRIGVALNKCINLPLSEIQSADLKMLGDGKGSIVLKLKGVPKLGYMMLWPHARSLRIVAPQPVLRAIPDARNVAQMLFKATQQVQPVAPRAKTSPNIPLKGATA
jgi:Bacterial PH domain